MTAAAVRRRVVPATEPGAEPVCRLTREEGQRRQAEVDKLFSMLAEHRRAGDGDEWLFQGDRDELWQAVSAFVDEEARCCPFFTFEQEERPDGVLLRVRRL